MCVNRPANDKQLQFLFLFVCVKRQSLAVDCDVGLIYTLKQERGTVSFKGHVEGQCQGLQ